MSSVQASNASVYQLDDEKYHDNVLQSGAVVYRVEECIKMEEKHLFSAP